MSGADELDVLLYAWLAEPEPHRADLRFTSYFQAAFPAICRYLRSLHADPATAQDLAQQALIKLFSHLGKGRRESAELVRQAISALRPLDFGALHVRQVASWRQRVSGFRDAAIGFRASREPEDVSGPWKELRQEVNGRVPPLVRQGAHFIGEVISRIGPALSPLLLAEKPGSALEEPSGEDVERFAEQLRQYAQGKSSVEVDSALGSLGASDFVTHIDAVRTNLPALAIPSNGLLYTIAKRRFLDALRSAQPETVQPVERLADGGDDGVLEALDVEATNGAYEAPAEPSSWAPATEVGVDESESDAETRYRAFLDLLRAPLTRAEGALAAATAGGKGKAEQARVESLRAKYARVLAVLAALREEPQPSEEQIARREGLSRNQVKYVIERIREEFARFFPDLLREAQGRRKRQGAQY